MREFSVRRADGKKVTVASDTVEFNSLGYACFYCHAPDNTEHCDKQTDHGQMSIVAMHYMPLHVIDKEPHSGGVK